MAPLRDQAGVTGTSDGVGAVKRGRPPPAPTTYTLHSPTSSALRRAWPRPAWRRRALGVPGAAGALTDLPSFLRRSPRRDGSPSVSTATTTRLASTAATAASATRLRLTASGRQDDVHRVVAAEAGGERLVGAEQGEVVRVGVLGPPAAGVLDHSAPERDAAEGGGQPVELRAGLADLVQHRLGGLALAQGVDAAGVAPARRRVAPGGQGQAQDRAAARFHPLSRRPGHGVGPGAQAGTARPRIHMPDPPAEDGLDGGLARAHAGTGSSTGSLAGAGAGAGAGVGSSTGTTSISRSLSGLP